MQRSVRAAIAAAVVCVSAALAWANQQPMYCSPGFGDGTPDVQWPGGHISTDWKQELLCTPLDPRNPHPCYFCLQCRLYVNVGGQWVRPKPSSTGVGPTNSSGYELTCGEDVQERWQLDWGDYPSGLYRMRFLGGICTDEPCSHCQYKQIKVTDFHF
jgi:hypothetical protein